VSLWYFAVLFKQPSTSNGYATNETLQVKKPYQSNPIGLETKLKISSSRSQSRNFCPVAGPPIISAIGFTFLVHVSMCLDDPDGMNWHEGVEEGCLI
jgi:hypothetical protein